MNFDKMTKKEMHDMLNKAKDAYYNSGQEIMSDAEYDELERRAGLENNNYIGSERGNYDVKHAFSMGSLAKVQIKEHNNTVNWNEATNIINSFLHKANGCKYFEITPKLDGCSFSAEFKHINGECVLSSVATRGNGKWGSNIREWFEPHLQNKEWSKIDDAVKHLCENNSDDILCIRGEVLISEKEFSRTYSETYTNPRSLVAGVLGLKREDATPEKLAIGKDLHFVCYDYRLYKNNQYIELSWLNQYDPTYKKLSPYLDGIGELPEYSRIYEYNRDIYPEDLAIIYNDYDSYRKNDSVYALDGIVFKPECSARKYNENRGRPEDCIAMKFMPMINATKIIDISWRVGKTGEYFPTAIVSPITMPDGKKINKASMHNYGWIVNNQCGIGSSVRISLAGDIIPYVYEIVEHVPAEGNMNLPENTYLRTEESGAMHLMKKFTENEENENKFINSAMTLNINTIGPAAAKELYDACCDDIQDLSNIIFLMNDDAYKLIYDKLGDGKSIQNYVDNMRQFAGHITLVDIIRSFNFKLCGHKASEVCARIMSGKSYSPNSLPAESYAWAMDKNSRQYFMVQQAMEELDVDLEIEDEDNNEDKIKVILTGSPDAFGYKTKSAFMQQHPEYVETTSWKEVQLLITDDLESNSGKMQKARKAGIPIKTYGDSGENKQAQQQEFDFNSESLF